MIRRLIEWLLGIQRVRKPAIECLMDLFPYVYAAMLIVGAVKQFGPFPLLPWYKRLWLRIRRLFQRARMVIVGY